MLKKIIRLLLNGRVKPVNIKPAYQFLLDADNFRVGNGTELTNFKLDIFGAIPNNLNVQIGDNCLIQGKVVLYSPNAKLKIGDRVFIGPDTTIFCYTDIEIEDDVMISWGCTLIDTNAHSLSSQERLNDVTDWKKGWQHKNWDVVNSKPIVIKKQSWIGFNSIITKGVTLGDGCVVAAGSVVTASFGGFSVIGGNPAKFIKQTN